MPDQIIQTTTATAINPSAIQLDAPSKRSERDDVRNYDVRLTPKFSCKHI